MAEDADDAADDPLRVWRVLGAMSLGFEWADATDLADREIDLHELAALIEAGATPDQARRILC